MIRQLAISALSLLAASAGAEPAAWKLPDLPTADEVGRDCLPDTIAPVVAPFDTIKFVNPGFPDATVRLKLAADRLNTRGIQTAINALANAGGGTVVVPPGEWPTGRIELMSHVRLHLEDGAALRFSGRLEDYQPAVFTRVEGVEVMSLGACIYANGREHIAVTGGGRLTGPGADAFRDRVERSDVIENVVSPKTPVAERIYDGSQPSGSVFPPMMISFVHCRDVFIEGVSLSNSAFWNIVPIYCERVIIRGVRVDSVGIPRGDGIDIDSSRDVLIEWCTLNCGDDCFTLKAGRGRDGLRVSKSTENVVIRHCLALQGHGGITCGSETAGWIRNVHVHDCVFQDTTVGIRFKTRRPRGGGGEHLSYERIRMNVRGTAFKWDMLGQPLYVGELAKRLPAREVDELTPAYRHITARDIAIDRCGWFVQAHGIPESPIEGLRMENIAVRCDKILVARDLSGATFRHIITESSDRLLKLVNVRGVNFEDVAFATRNVPVRLITEEGDPADIAVRHCPDLRLKDGAETRSSGQ